MCSSLGLLDVLLDLIGHMHEFAFSSFRAFSIFLEIFALAGMPILALLIGTKTLKPPITGRPIGFAFLAVSGSTQQRGSQAVLKLHAFLAVSRNTQQRRSQALLKLHAFLAVSGNTQQRGSQAVLKLHAFLAVSGNTRQRSSQAVLKVHAFLAVSGNRVLANWQTSLQPQSKQAQAMSAKR